MGTEKDFKKLVPLLSHPWIKGGTEVGQKNKNAHSYLLQAFKITQEKNIRTHVIFQIPKQMRYQAALRSEKMKISLLTCFVKKYVQPNKFCGNVGQNPIVPVLAAWTSPF